MSQSLTTRAAWHGFKAFAALRVITLLWVLMFSMMGGRTITEPDVYCKTQPLVENHLDAGLFLKSALRWDAVCYLLIAEHGYLPQPGLTIWPPGYPILIHAFALVFQPPILAALIVSSLATWLAFTLLYLLVAENHEEAIARNVLFLYVIFPHSLFFISAYSEATFFVFVLASLLLAQKKHWIWAGIFAAAASLTRQIGILLSLALLWEGIIQFRENRPGKFSNLIKPVIAASLSVVGYGAFSLYTHEVLKIGWPWQIVGSYWHLGWPWQGILANAKLLLTVSISPDLYWLPTTLLDLIFAIAILITLAFNLRLGRSAHMVYAWMIVLISLIKLEPDYRLWAFSRYIITAFPFFVALVPALNNKYARLGALAFGLVFQGILLYMFYIWSWAG